MTAPRWLEIAWEQDGAGVAEIGGPRANASIIGYFHGIGRTDVTSDEIYWCMAAYAWCLQKSGVSIDHIPKKDRLLAVSALKIGTRIAEPRVGCGVVMKRYNKDGSLAGHHVGFVTAWTARTIFILGGNQVDSFCEKEFKRTADMIFMWPEPAKTAKEVEAEGSRIAAAARQQRGDTVKTTVPNAVPPPPAPDMPAPEVLTAKFGAWQSVVESGISFLQFLSHRWPWAMFFVSLYFAARLLWNSHLIRKWRAEMTNTGAVTGPAGASVAHSASAPLPDPEAAHADVLV